MQSVYATNAIAMQSNFVASFEIYYLIDIRLHSIPFQFNPIIILSSQNHSLLFL